MEASTLERGDPVPDRPQPSEMKDVANDLLRGYLALLDRGHDERTVAEAMLGAAINLYDLLDLSGELPLLLRGIADRIECDCRLS